MKSELAKKLKNLLDNMSQEEFDLAWQEVAERNVDSPSFAEYLQFLNDSDLNETVKYQMSEFQNAYVNNVVDYSDFELNSAA